MKDKLGQIAIRIIYPDHVSDILKKAGYNYHIDYYKELAKTDPKIEKVLSMFSLEELQDNPSLVHPTINTELGREGNIILLNMVPQIPNPTCLFVACMPATINEYQKEELSRLPKTSYEFLDFGIYDPSLDEYVSYMQEEDYNHENFYLIEKYLEEQKNLKKE